MTLFASNQCFFFKFLQTDWSQWGQLSKGICFPKTLILAICNITHTHILNYTFFIFRTKTIDENEIKIKIEPIQIYEKNIVDLSQHVSNRYNYSKNSTTPTYGNKRFQGFRPGYGQGDVRDLAGHLKPKVLYQKSTPSPMIKLSCGKTQNDSTVSKNVQKSALYCRLKGKKKQHFWKIYVYQAGG